MSVFTEAAAVLFSDTNFSELATLLPAAGDSAPVSVIRGREAVAVGEFGNVLEYRDTFLFLLSEASPSRGDQVVIGLDAWRLDGVTPGGDDGIVRRLFALRVVAQLAYLITSDGDRLVTADGDYLMAA